MKTLLLIDLQYDFLPGGALAVPDGDQVVAFAGQLISRYEEVVASQDWHPANHGSFASQHPGLKVGDQFVLDGLPQVAWPDHCVQGTNGAALHASLPIDRITFTVQKGMNPMIDSYSAFFDNGQRQSTPLHSYLQSRRVSEIDVIGLATDYCVRASVLDGLQLGYRVRVLLDGCRGVNLKSGDIDQAIQEMVAAGAECL